jgi:hypothetical protein
MGYLSHIKRTILPLDTRWIVKFTPKGKIREVKQIYKPSEYYAENKHKGKNARPLHNQNALIKILEDDKKENNS